jgi:hypothetical protein
MTAGDGGVHAMSVHRRPRPFRNGGGITLSQTKRGQRLLRKDEARKRLGIGRTKFEEDFIKTGRLRLVPISERIDGIVEDELDVVIEEIIATRETAAPSGRIPQARDSASGRFTKKEKAVRVESATS